ncbi:MAG TPA: ASKHA domain-containing protein, partial [Candidatus Brocadiia bacterium]|nr:ASKHA domain-containing protein [Candidatus Brocadiia bacterium]
MPDSVRVTFQPEGRAVFVLAGSLLCEAAVKAGITITSPCGGNGTCGKCRVLVTKGAPPPTEQCSRLVSAEDLARGVRLACQMHVTQDTVVEIPKESRFYNQKILTHGVGREVDLEPDVRKVHVRLPQPSLEDQRADSDRLVEAVQPGARIPLSVLRGLPGQIRAANGEVTAVVAGDEILSVEPGDTSAANYGMAFDIGTTTVVGMLIDLTKGDDLAVAARTNPQVAHGDDVIARIGFAATETGRRLLQSRIVGCLNEIIDECCATAGIESSTIYEITVAGNTTMNHLLLGIQPDYVAQSPYVAALRDALDTPAAELGIHIHPRGNVHTLPNIAGFVGGDTVGVILATGLLDADKLTLAIDIGTNGEIVAGTKDRLVSCSTAAGPAFEGARIAFGMRAASGAIDKLVLDGDVRINVIGGQKPRGLCGTAVIDAVAELLRVGIVDSTGRIVPPGECPAD